MPEKNRSTHNAVLSCRTLSLQGSWHNQRLAWGLGQRAGPLLHLHTPGGMSSALDLLLVKELD